MRMGYCRVSTAEQNITRQEEALKNVDRMYIDKLSGKDTDRPELKAMLLNIRQDDVVEVLSLDRLARNLKDLLSIVEEITNKGATIKFVKENMEFSNNDQNPMSKMMLGMLGCFAEFERNIINQRCQMGREIAKAQGKYKGKPKGSKTKLTDIEIIDLKKLYENGTNINQLSKRYNISRPTVYKYLEEK